MVLFAIPLCESDQVLELPRSAVRVPSLDEFTAPLLRGNGAEGNSLVEETTYRGELGEIVCLQFSCAGFVLAFNQ